MSFNNVSNVKETKVRVDYLRELLMDRTILTNYPNVFLHVSKILEKEILRTRSALLSIYGIYSISDSDLPEPSGPKVNLQCKVYMPADANSSFNFVGRILGPDGSTAKCLQQCLGVKIMVRGRGSMRDRKKEEANIGRPNWEHLSDKLHVVLTVDDFESRAKARLAKASDYITLFLKESTKGSDGEDKVKQMQLMELSFQRDLRSSWSLDCHNLMELGKTGSLYPGPANLLNFAYPATYPPAPLFSAIHEASTQHHGQSAGFHARHYYSSPGTAQQMSQQTQPAGQQQQHQQQPQQQQQQQHSQGHFTSVPATHGGHNSQHMAAAAAAAMSVGGLAFSSSSLSGNLGSATLLLGPANAQSHHHHHHHHQQQHHHPGTYSPPTVGQGNSATALPAGTVAVAPINYWQAAQSVGPHALSQMTAAATPAAFDYHHAQLHHPQLHQTGHEHVPQAAGYSLSAAPYATAAQLQPIGYSGEMLQSQLGQDFSLCARECQPMESTVGGMLANGMNSEMLLNPSLGDVRCSEATSSAGNALATAGTATVNSQDAGNDTPVAEQQPTASPEKSSKQVPANSGSGATATVASVIKTSSSGANQAPAKFSVGPGSTGSKHRYLQKHHSQFNIARNSQQQPQASSLSMHTTLQQQHGPRTGRSEIVTVHVGSTEQSGTDTKSVHSTCGGESNHKGGFVTAKQKTSSTGSTESSSVKTETGGTFAASTVKETRGSAATKPQATSANQKTALTGVVTTNEADWPKLGAEIKFSKLNPAADSQISQGIVNLSIGNTSSKAI